MTNLVKQPRSNAQPAEEDFYARLGVSRTATAAEIRKAYRRAAQDWHPDRNGGSEEAKATFQRIQAAYDVLSNPEQREFYDATGLNRPSDDEMQAMAKDIMMQVFALHIEMGPKDENVDLEAFECINIVKNVVKHLTTQANSLHNDAQKQQKILSKLETMLRRFRRTQGSFEDSPVARLVREKIENTKKLKVQNEMNAKLHEFAIPLAEEYGYDAAEPKPRPMWSGTPIYHNNQMIDVAAMEQLIKDQFGHR